jgi:molybdopterin converting factor small subunit
MKRLVIGLLLVVVLLGALACSAASPSEENKSAPAAESDGFWGGEIDAEVPPMEMPEMVVPTAPVPAPGMSVAEVSYDEEAWSGERMIVRTGDISLVVTDVATAMQQIVNMAAGYNGWVVSSNNWRDGDRLVGNISFRVPSESFDGAVQTLHGLAEEVTQESTYSTDVTSEYVDLSARLHNLEASEAQLLELLKQAGDVSDILEVQRELADTRGEIEQAKGRMQYLEQTSATSLINVNLQQAALDVTFTANNRRVEDGQEVYFSPQIAGGISPYTYEWDFGDGTTSTEVSPSHVYDDEGSYNVSLKVTDDRGNTDAHDRSNYIEVIPGWSAGNTARSAWNGLATIGRVAVDALIWVVYLIPVWIVIGVILYFAWWRPKRKKNA